MDQKLINANVYQMLQDLCKHCVQTRQEPQQVLSYFLDQKKKGFDFVSFSYMVSKIFPNSSPFIQNCCFKFISEKYQTNIVSVQQIAELLQKIKTQTQENELQKPILSKIVNSQPISSVNSSQKKQQPMQHRAVDQIIDIFMKNLVRVQINLIELFQKFDQNKDNYMNQDEFVTMFSRVVKDLNDQEYSILINYFFRDNRELTAFQFKKLCENQQVNIMESNYYENPANANLLRSNIQFSELHVDNINLIAMQEFIKRYEQLKRDRQQYIDQSFPPNQQSLGVSKFKNLQWKRISQFSKEEPKFFVKENSANRFGLGKWICPDDLLQGQLGDCYFLASISSLGNRRPDLLLDVFITRTFNPQGMYGVKLCVDGEWKVIGIDDHIPTLYDKPAFTKGKNSEIWVMVIEKAWAKLFNSYENIEAGYPTEVLHCLTGAPTRTIFTSDDDFVQQLEQCINLRCIMVCASKKTEEQNMKEMGLIPSHAYTVLKIKNLNADTRLIKLRNPWGKQEWKGLWSDLSPLWTPELKQQFKISNVNDGIFYMNIPDFRKYFDDLSVCYVKDNYKYQSLNLESNNKNSQYISITVQVDGFYFFTANQRNKRFENSFDYSPVKILLLQENEFLVGNFKEARECWVGQHLKKGAYIVVIKTLWKFGKINKFVFSSYGPGQVQIQKIQKIQDLLYKIIMQQARKSKKLEGYKKNPAIQRGYEFFTSYGYGYIYVVNNSDQSFETTMTMTQFSGLKLRKPYRGEQLKISLGPGEEFLAIVNVSHNGYKFGMEEKFIIK